MDIARLVNKVYFRAAKHIKISPNDQCNMLKHQNIIQNVDTDCPKSCYS